MIETKICTKCKRELPLTQFHRYNRRGATHYPQCRDCKAQYKKENKDKLLISQYARRKNPSAEDKLKKKAWNALNNALKKGTKLKSEFCEVCGASDNIQAHHADYSKPIEVTWCCQMCHARLDNIRRLA